jgi:hypothetical protein
MVEQLGGGGVCGGARCDGWRRCCGSVRGSSKNEVGGVGRYQPFAVCLLCFSWDDASG